MSTTRRVFAISFLGCWAIGAFWAAASAPFSGPDETAQVNRAYAAGGGDLVGEDAGFRPGIVGEVTRVKVPRSLGDLGGAIGCFAFHPEVPAGCATAVRPGTGSKYYETTSGRTPPLYHLLVSPPLRAWPNLLGLYLARVLGAGLAAGLLAGAVTVTWTRRRRGMLVGTFVACTPMVWFLDGVVNPSSLEIAGAIAAWVGGACVLDDWHRGRSAGTGALVVLAAGGASTALARSLGPLWLGLIGLTLLAMALADGTAKRVLAEWRVQAAAAVIVVATVANVTWVLASGALSGSEGLTLRAHEAIALSLGRQMTMWQSAIGNFGYLDTRLPDGVAVTWVGLGLLLFLLAFSASRGRDRLVLLGLLGVTLVVPVAVEANQLDQLGPVWQGRYTLPLLVGIPVLAGWMIDRREHLVPTAMTLHRSVVVLATVAHAAAYWFAIRRYAVGTGGKVWFFRDDTWLTWKLAPITFGGLVVIAAVGWFAQRAVVTVGTPVTVEPTATSSWAASRPD